jgi:hypothetical protein
MVFRGEGAVMLNYKTLHRLFVLRIAFELLVALLVVVTIFSRRYYSQFGMYFLIALLSAGALWLIFYFIQVRADREHLLNYKRLQLLRETDTDLYHLQRFYLTRVIPAERLVLGIAAILGIAQRHMS